MDTYLTSAQLAHCGTEAGSVMQPLGIQIFIEVE